MQRFSVKYKNCPTSAEVHNIEAATAADALRQAAQMLGMDTDPLTQTYTLALEAIPQKEPAHIRQARRELANYQRGHILTDAELRRRRALIEWDKPARTPDDETPDARPLYLIACSGSKLDQPAKARDLYTGQAFRFAMKAADRAGADVLILSALHGVVDPDAWLNPYNVTLNEMTAADRRAWAEKTAAELTAHHGREVVVLAGSHYAEATRELNATYPLAGLGIGQQLQKLKTLAGETAPPVKREFQGQQALF